MTAELGAMLDELMGQYRNEDPSKVKVQETTFKDDKVCKFNLCGFCPHDLFVNTKYDLGPCQYSHDQRYKDQYEADPRKGTYGYEEKWEAFLRRLHNEMQNKIAKARARLETTQGESSGCDPERQKLALRVEELNTKINELLAKIGTAQDLGDQVTMATLQTECDRYKIERQNAYRLLKQYDSEGQGMNGKPMDVCSVCACFSVQGEAPNRVQDHLTGKLHMGYLKIKNTLEELEEQKKERREKEEKEREERRKRREEEEKERREKRTRRSRSRSRDRRHSSHRFDASRRDRDSRSSRSDRYRDDDRRSSRYDRDRRRSRSRSRDRRRHRSRDRKSSHKDRRHSRSRSSSHKRDDKSVDKHERADTVSPEENIESTEVQNFTSNSSVVPHTGQNGNGNTAATTGDTNGPSE